MTTRHTRRLLPHGTDAPRLLLIGVSHRCAPLELRERVTYDAEAARTLLQSLQASEEIAEAFLLSTCNRTEIYLLPDRDAAAYRLALQQVFLARAPEIEAEGRFYVKRGDDAAHHLFQVAGGLRSMVLGEPEVLSQVRRAARLAEEAAASGDVLRRLLRSAVAAGARVRRDTSIASGAVSYGYAVVELARGLFERIELCSVLLVGAGETARQAARNLLERGVGEIVVTNRSPGRVEEFLALFPQARAVPFDRRREAIDGADVIVASTAAAKPVLSREDLAAAMAVRGPRPLLVVDLGVPRNVEVRTGELANLVLHDIDSLEDLIAENLKRRRDEIPWSQEILDHELEHFLAWYRGRVAEPLIAQLQKRAERIRRREVASLRKHFPPETHPQLEQLTRSVVRKILHHPSVYLRTAERRQLDVVRRLFRLDEDE